MTGVDAKRRIETTLVRAWRNELGFSQTTFGAVLGVSRQAVYDWERYGIGPEGLVRIHHFAVEHGKARLRKMTYRMIKSQLGLVSR